jgi:Amino acid synthesis
VTLVRKVVAVIEDTLVERRKAVPRPFRMVAAAVVLTNPRPTREHVDQTGAPLRAG